MIQFNLIPEVKREFLRRQKLRNFVLSVSVIVSAVCLGIFIILFALKTFQQHHITSMNTAIASDNSTLSNDKEISKLLTIQNQLKSLPALYDGRVQASNLTNYLEETTPSNVFITQLSVDFATNQITLSGTTNSYASIEQYADTLTYTSITQPGKNTNGNSCYASNTNCAFSTVNISSENYSNPADDLNAAQSNPDQAASFTLTFNFEPSLFTEKTSSNITLVVPNATTTKSYLDQPLFDATSTPSTTKQGGTN